MFERQYLIHSCSSYKLNDGTVKGGTGVKQIDEYYWKRTPEQYAKEFCRINGLTYHGVFLEHELKEKYNQVRTMLGFVVCENVAYLDSILF